MPKQPQLVIDSQFKKKLTAEQKIRLNYLIDEFAKLGETLNINYGYQHNLVTEDGFYNTAELPLIDYKTQFQLTIDDLPILAVMIGSDKLYFHKDENKFFVTLHSACAISDLGVQGSEVLLINQVYRHDMHDNGWISELYPFYLAKFGQSGLNSLQLALDDSKKPFVKAVFAETLEIIAKQQPDNRQQAIEMLVKQLQNFAQNDTTYNSFVIYYLTNLKQIEQLPLIKQVFDANKADLLHQGDYEEIEMELGVRQERSTPKPKTMAELQQFSVKPNNRLEQTSLVQAMQDVKN